MGQSFFKSSLQFNHFSVISSLPLAHSSRDDTSHFSSLICCLASPQGYFIPMPHLVHVEARQNSSYVCLLGYHASFREEMTAHILKYLSSYLPCLTLDSWSCYRTFSCWGFADSQLFKTYLIKHLLYPVQKEGVISSTQTHPAVSGRNTALLSLKGGKGHRRW